MNKLKKKMSTIAAIAAASTIALSMIGTSASAISPAEQDGAILASYGGDARSASSYTDAYGNHVTVITTSNGTETYVNGERKQAVNSQTVNAIEANVTNQCNSTLSTSATNVTSYTRNGDTGGIYTEVKTVSGNYLIYRNGVLQGSSPISTLGGDSVQRTDDTIHAQSVGNQITAAQAREAELRGRTAMEQEAAQSNTIATANQTANTPASNNNVAQPVTTRTATAGGILVVTTDSKGKVISSHMEQPKTTYEIRAVQKERNKATSASNSTSSASSSAASNGHTSTSSANRNTSTSSSSSSSYNAAQQAAQQRAAQQAAAGAARGAAAMAQYASSSSSTSSSSRNTSTSSSRNTSASSSSSSSSSKSYNSAQQAGQQKAAEQAAAGAARGAAAMAQYANKK